MSKITSLIEYLDWIRTEKTVNGFTQDVVHYRGQSNSLWGLTPAVFRPIGGVGFYNEHDLILDAQTQCWRWLQDCHSELDQLVKLQHFGLKTRLLDFTSNPLIALYFACCSEESSDGVVYCSFKEISDISIAKLIARIVANHNVVEFNISDEKLLLYAKSVGLNISKCCIIREMLSKPHVIVCPFNNERISNQNGLFVIAPLFKDKTTEFLFSRELDFSNPKFELLSRNKVIIESTSKPQILRELAQIGISEKYIFPDFEHTLISINRSHSIGKNWKIDD